MNARIISKLCSILIFFSIFNVCGMYNILELGQDPFFDAEKYIGEKKDELSGIEKKVSDLETQAVEATLTAEQKETLDTLESSKKELKDDIKNYEDAYTAFQGAEKAFNEASTSAEQEAALEERDAAVKTGNDAKDKIDPLAEDLQKKIDDLSKELEIPEKENGTSSSGAEDGEEAEDPMLEALIEGLMKYLELLILPSWYAETYLSLPEFAFELFELLFEPAEITWPALPYIPDSDISSFQDDSNTLSTTVALTYFNTLQEHKAYVIETMQTFFEILDFRSKEMMLAAGNQLNRILYKIQQHDPTVFYDIAGLQTITSQKPMISILVDLIKENSVTLSQITLDYRYLPPPTEEPYMINKYDVIDAMKTMQKIEGMFLLEVLWILSGSITPTLEEQQALQDLAQYILNLESSIKNGDPKVFSDLENAQDELAKSASVIADQLPDDIDLASQLDAIKSFIEQHSQQPTEEINTPSS